MIQEDRLMILGQGEKRGGRPLAFTVEKWRREGDFTVAYSARNRAASWPRTSRQHAGTRSEGERWCACGVGTLHAGGVPDPVPTVGRPPSPIAGVPVWTGLVVGSGHPGSSVDGISGKSGPAH